jgi:hypothetical protein
MQEADRVLHIVPPTEVELVLVFRRWQRQSGALFSPLHFKVMLALENLPAHVWSLEVTQEVVRTSRAIFDQAPSSSAATDMSQYIVAAWALHLDLIPIEVGCIVLEPEEPSEVGRPLLRASEIMHSKRDMMQFRVSIKIIKIHDFSSRDDSSDDDSSGSRDSGGGGLPGSGSSSLRPWPRVFQATDESSASENPWPSLLSYGGGVS